MDFILSSLKNQFSQQPTPTPTPTSTTTSAAIISPPSAPRSNLFIDIATDVDNNNNNESLFYTQPFPAVVAAKQQQQEQQIKIKQEHATPQTSSSSSNSSTSDDDEDDMYTDVDGFVDLKAWAIPDIPSQQQQQQQQSSSPLKHDITPYLYRVLVVDFYNNVSSHAGVSFIDLFDTEFFLTIPCPITSENIALDTFIFDRWFIRCCKIPFIVERAWSLVVTLNNRKFGFYRNLVLCRNPEIRYKFAELCACIYLDTKIETSTWKFSIHNPEDENKHIMTMHKNEIQQHELRKARLFNFFKSPDAVGSIIHVSSARILTNVVFGSENLFKDVCVDVYTSLMQESIKQTGVNPFNSIDVAVKDAVDISNNEFNPRHQLFLLEMGAANQPLAQTWMFHTDELNVLESINKILQIEYTDMDIIVNDTYTRILFATAVGYAYRKRHMRNTLTHVPNSMRARIDKAKLSVEIQLAKVYLRLGGGTNDNNRIRR